MRIETLTYYLKLLACEGIGVLNARKLLDCCQEVSDIFNQETLKTIVENQVLCDRLLKSINKIDPVLIANELDFIVQNNIQFVGILEEHYPRLLKECADAPIVLFYKGDLSLLNRKPLAVVGTRKITAYGKEMITNLLAELKPYQPAIISGMAYGVDVYAYYEARKNELPAIAVMGTSFIKYYPKSHEKYYKDLEINGLIITEYACFNKLAPELFLRRNRIIAGLSQATVVIESAETGGSLSTAFFAMEYDREVYAIPGKITDTYSKGCLKLIQQHKAQLLFDFQQIADDLNWNLLKKNEQIKPEPILDLTTFTETEQQILKTLQSNPLHIDDLAFETGLDISVLNANLLMLELNGVVIGLQGKIFQLK